jgi:hypothetical protein
MGVLVVIFDFIFKWVFDIIIVEHQLGTVVYTRNMLGVYLCNMAVKQYKWLRVSKNVYVPNNLK